MTTTHQTPILDNAYTVRTVATVEAGQQFATVFVTNNDNGVTIGGEKTKKEFAGPIADLHASEVASSIEILTSGINWVARVVEGETTIITK
jgi:hypothetical protein